MASNLLAMASEHSVLILQAAQKGEDMKELDPTSGSLPLSDVEINWLMLEPGRPGRLARPGRHWENTSRKTTPCVFASGPPQNGGSSRGIGTLAVGAAVTL